MIKAVGAISLGWLQYKAYKLVRLQAEAVAKICAAYRMRRCMNRFQRQRKAASTIVNGSWMWRHMRLRRERRHACTKISALWRGYCVRVNVNTIKQAVSKIKT